jgi:hypothetical protein
MLVNDDRLSERAACQEKKACSNDDDEIDSFA